MNVCQHAAIIGIDGSVWAQSANMPNLTEYDCEIEDETGNKKTIKVNEFVSVLAAANGSRNPSAAGIRIGGQKYIFMKHEKDPYFTQLSKDNGGALLAKTRNAVVIGIWDKSELMTDNQAQNNPDAGLRVEVVANLLRDAEY